LQTIFFILIETCIQKGVGYILHKSKVVCPSENENLLERFDVKLTLVLMVSSTGKMAPPVFIFPTRGFIPFTIPNEEFLLLHNTCAKSMEETNFENILPFFLNYIEEGSVLMYDETQCHLSTRIVNLLGTKRIDGIRIPTGTNKVVAPIEASLQKIIKYSVRGSFVSWCLDLLILNRRNSVCVYKSKAGFFLAFFLF